VQAFFQVLGDARFSMVSAQQGTKQATSVNIFATAIGVGQNSFLKVISVLAREVNQRWV